MACRRRIRSGSEPRLEGDRMEEAETRMSETTDPKASTPGETTRRPTDARDLVRARLYSSEEEVLRDALRHLLRARPDARVHVAVHRYQTESLSLAKAADLAGV